VTEEQCNRKEERMVKNDHFFPRGKKKKMTRLEEKKDIPITCCS
jgi:hypothetical protein